MLKSYKDLKVWRKSYQLSLLVYKVTSNFPKSELYGLVSQMRRAAIAISSNIAEGYARQYSKEYIQFLSVAYSSASELETQVLLAHDLGFLKEEDFKKVYGLQQEVAKMLYKLMVSLRKKP